VAATWRLDAPQSAGIAHADWLSHVRFPMPMLLKTWTPAGSRTAGIPLCIISPYLGDVHTLAYHLRNATRKQIRTEMFR